MEWNRSRHTRHTLAELMTQDTYTPEDVAELLGIDVNVVRHAAFNGTLPAEIISHDIVTIRREDVLAWFDSQR